MWALARRERGTAGTLTRIEPLVTRPSAPASWRDRLWEAFAFPTRSERLWSFAIVLVCLGLATALVYETGGVKFAQVHALYVPVILAALIFELPGALLVGLVAGLLVGPLMPIDTATGEKQEFLNWVNRLVFFCLIGAIVGVGTAALRRAMQHLRWLNNHDPETGLLTRSGFVEEIDRVLCDPGCPSTPYIIVVHLNNILDIRNTFGIDFSNKLLVGICARGRSLVPAHLPMSLIQPDRIGVMLSSAPEARDLRDRIEVRMREPYDVDGVLTYVDFAVGAAAYPIHGREGEALVQKASIAMHTAVKRKLPSLLYDNQADETSRDNLVLLGAIPPALATDQLSVWHQAKTALDTGEVVATEALLRWHHPERGMIPPAAFIPQVEDSPLINDLTRWLIGQALDHQAAWTALGHHVTVSINLSVRNLHDRSLLHVLDDAVSQHGIAANEVDLELTESAVMADFSYCAKLIGKLRDRGHLVSIDDFGTGHSSLAYLKGLPITTLKIDQAFVKNLAIDASDQKITRAIVDLAHALGLTTVAEGIEDAESAALLREWGCEYGQGFYFHKPCPYPDLIAWLEQRSRRDDRRAEPTRITR